MESRPPTLQLRHARWDWSRPYLLGVVNVTPDSFSDGGRVRTEDAVRHALALVAEGADALDVGGESTRPGAPPVTEAEELARVVPVVEALAARAGVPVSVDTTKAAVAEAALAAGAEVLNDVGMGDPPATLGTVAARAGAAYLAMHARGTPATMRALTDYDDVVHDVARALGATADALVAAGVARERVLVDPGVGFAKTADQSLALLADLAPVMALGYAVCVGPSRKSFIDAADAYDAGWRVAPGAASARVGGTAAAVTAAVLQGAHVLRVHDVAVMRQAARVAHAMRLRRRAAW
ncbi:MAG: dihydropteroate synthase [Polyangiales bacterium]